MVQRDQVGRQFSVLPLEGASPVADEVITGLNKPVPVTGSLWIIGVCSFHACRVVIMFPEKKAELSFKHPAMEPLREKFEYLDSASLLGFFFFLL